MKVSVIIPNYNHAPYLRQRIESVLNQSYQNFELIMLDDKSTDDSISIINSYVSHPKVSKIVLNEVNTGSPFVQWQKAFSLAKGEYIWIAESDDFIDDEFLTDVMQTFNRNKEVGLVYCDSNVVDSNGTVKSAFYSQLKNKNFSTTKWNTNYVQNGWKEITEVLYFDCTINNMSATVFKKDLLQYLNWTELLQFRYCGDWYFLMTLVKNCDVAYLCKPYNYFRFATNNFKKGTRSVLNYFRERALVKYFFWHEAKLRLTNVEKEKVYTQLGSELQIQLNEAIKLKSPALKTIKVMQLYKSISKELFKNQFKATVYRYFRKR